MKLEDLESLKLAIDTGNIDYFNGDMSQAFIDVVEELIEIKSKEEDATDKLQELKDQVMEKADELTKTIGALDRLLE